MSLVEPPQYRPRRGAAALRWRRRSDLGGSDAFRLSSEVVRLEWQTVPLRPAVDGSSCRRINSCVSEFHHRTRPESVGQRFAAPKELLVAIASHR